MYRPEHAAAAGAAIGALIAHSQSLEKLHIHNCDLGDAGMGPIVDALPHARCLHTLNCPNNAMSEAFARERLLPAVRACASLRTLKATQPWDGVGPAAREAELLVQQRN